MTEETEINEIKSDLKAHVIKHDEDYKKLLWWIIATLVTMIFALAGGFLSLGHDQERISQLEKQQETYISRVEFTGTVALMNNKLNNIDDKLIDLKQGLNIR